MSTDAQQQRRDVHHLLVTASEEFRASAAAEPLIVALGDPNDAVRIEATDSLEDLGEGAVEPLIAALVDSSEKVREGAAFALGTIGDHRAVDSLCKALADANEKVRNAAAFALGQIGDQRAIKPLSDCLTDGFEQVRSTAAQSLGLIGDARAVEPLIGALADSSEQVRSGAAQALGLLGQPGFEPLLDALTDADEDVRDSAVWALGKIGDPRATEPVIAALLDSQSNGPTVRARAAWALGEIGDPRAVDALIETVGQPYPDESEAAAASLCSIGEPAVEPLIAAMPDSRDCIAVLGDIGDPRAVEPLIVALHDEDSQGSAARALGKIGDPRAVEPLAAVLAENSQPDTVKEALGESAVERGMTLLDLGSVQAVIEGLDGLGEAAVEPLIAILLEQEDPGVRAAAAEALGVIGDARAVQPLATALREVTYSFDPDDNPRTALREAASKALARIGGPEAERAVTRYKRRRYPATVGFWSAIVLSVTLGLGILVATPLVLLTDITFDEVVSLGWLVDLVTLIAVWILFWTVIWVVMSWGRAITPRGLDPFR